MATVVLASAAARRAGPGVRGLLVKLHRYVGLAIAAFLILAGVTGSVLVFQREIDAALNPQLWRVAAPGPALSPQAIADRIAAADPRVTARWIPLEARPATAADVWVDWMPDPASGAPAERRYDQMFVDPVSGKLLGTRRYGACCFEREHLIPFLWSVHSSLFVPGRAGVLLLGIVAVLWTLDSINGLYLTLPRGRGRHRWWQSWRLKRGASPTRRTFDLHRAGGLWLWPLLILMGVSSIALTLPHELFEPTVARFSPISPEAYEGRPAHPAAAPRVSFDAALAAAQRAARGAGIAEPTSGIYFASEASMYGVRFGREEDAGVGQGWVFVDAGSGEVFRTVPATSGTAGDLVERIQLPIHAGRVLGLPTRVLAVAIGLGTAMLSVTGVLIWRRKRRAAKAHSQR